MSTRPATLDDAHAALLALLTEAVETELHTQSGHLIDDVYDGGADRHDRVVEFALTTTDGRAVGFSATIRVEDPSRPGPTPGSTAEHTVTAAATGMPLHDGGDGVLLLIDPTE